MTARAIAIWVVLAAAIGVPIFAAAGSPLLAWRQPVYIAAGFAGIIALGLLLVQPVLVGGLLPGLSAQAARHVHRWMGGILVIAVFMNEDAAISFQGGLAVVSVLSVVVIATLLVQGTALALILDWRPLRCLGERSYGLYL